MDAIEVSGEWWSPLESVSSMAVAVASSSSVFIVSAAFSSPMAANGESNGATARASVYSNGEKAPQPAIPYKFIIIVLVCLTSIAANSLTYSLTVTQFHSYGNGSAEDFFNFEFEDAERNTNETVMLRAYLSNQQKESLIMVMPVGAFLSIIPSAAAYNKWGFSRTFGFFLLLSVVTSSLVPTFTSVQTFSYAVIIRLFQGMSFGAFLPVIAKIGCFLSIEDFTLTTVVLFGYLALSAVFVFPVGGLLAASSLGWHSVHYSFAIFSAACFVVFAAYHFTGSHQRVKRQGRLFEVFYGTMAERHSSSMLTFHLPYVSIYQDLPIWGLLTAAFGYFGALQCTVQYMPIFLTKVAMYGTISSSFIAAVPALVGLLLSVITSLGHPKLPVFKGNKLLRMRLFNTISSVVPGIVFIIIAFLDPALHSDIITLLYIIGASALGFAGGGFFSAIRLRAGPFSVFIVANLHAVCFVSTALVTLLNVLIARNEEYNEWKALFLVEGVAMLLCNTIFCLFVTTEKAEWSKEGFQDTSFDPAGRTDPFPQRPL